MTDKRECSESTFRSHDQNELFYRTWEPAGAGENALIILHRGHEHSGRVQGIIDGLNLPDYWAFSFDARGHGNSPGKRGDAESFACMVQDLDCFVKKISSTHNIQIENILIVANSVGAVIAATWIHDYAPRIRGMVLAAPAFRIKLYVPFALLGLRLLKKIKKNAFIKSYIKPGMLTHDKEQAVLYAKDPLIARNISVRILLGLHDTSTRILQDAAAITVPALILSAGSDCVVRNREHRQFYNSISSRFKEYCKLDGFYHALFYEKDREKLFSMTRDFILTCFKNKYEPISLLDADKKGFTKDEFDYLNSSPNILKSCIYNFQIMSMQTLGRLSKGIQIGFKTGFNSGESLDHVYRNKAEGITPLGRLLDRIYLDAIGWRGVRIRKDNLCMAINEYIGKLKKSGRKVKIIDIASGPGRYVIETVENSIDNIESVLLRDFKEYNIKAAEELFSKLKTDKITAEQADAFKPESYSSLNITPNLAIVSGLFELFSDNHKIKTALDGLSLKMEKGGFILYTSQPWHPQVEMIARTLSGHEGERWVMRRRSQVEMDQLVAAAGFRKVDTKVGPFGIFNVSIAEKV